MPISPQTDPSSGSWIGPGYRIPIARDARRATMINEIADCSIVSTLAHRERTGVSDGENAVLVLKAMNR